MAGRLVVLAALAAGRAAAQGTWELVLMDDFDGTSLNSSLWTVAENNTQDAGQSIFISRNVAVADSVLTIQAVHEQYEFSECAHDGATRSRAATAAGWLTTAGLRGRRGRRGTTAMAGMCRPVSPRACGG